MGEAVQDKLDLHLLYNYLLLVEPLVSNGNVFDELLKTQEEIDISMQDIITNVLSVLFE
jgi:hypothetical protein